MRTHKLPQLGKLEKKRLMFAAIRSRVLEVLTVQPNMTALSVAGELSYPSAIVCTVVGNMVKAKLLYKSGEILIKAAYRPKYSIGESGLFTPAPEQKRGARNQPRELAAKKKISPIRLAKMTGTPKKPDRMKQNTVSAAQCTPVMVNNSWLGGLGL